MSGRFGMTSAVTRAAVLVLALSGGGAVACGPGATEDPADDPPAATEEPPAEEATGPDGASATEDAPEEGLSGPEAAWCELEDRDLIVLRSDDTVSCEEVGELFADVEDWSYPEGGEPLEEEQWECAIATGQIVESSEFTEVPLCIRGDSQLMALPPGTTPLDGFAVDMGEFAVVGGSGTEYGFSVPDTDLVCSIIPSEDGTRGMVGCHGTFEDGAEAEGPDGTEPATAVALEEDGVEFLVTGDPAFYPLDPDGDFAEDVPELPAGEVLSAYGVVCMSEEEGAVTCTAGPDAAMTVSSTAHEFTG